MNTDSTQCNRRQMTSLRHFAGLTLAVLPALAGCSHGPEYSIFGSFFPAWIFCSAGGLLFAASARAVITRVDVAEYVAVPVVFYLSVAIFVACVLWLLFYS